MTDLGPAASLSWIDWALLAVLAISVVVGLWRGFVFEVMSLVGWIAAYVAAQALTPLVAPHLPIGEPGSALNFGAGFALMFLGALIVWSLLARLVSLLVQATPLSLIDRVLGAGFGLLRGAVLLLALATVVAFTPAARSPQWQGSQGAAWLDAMLQGLKPVLPVNVARHLPG
ncbi:CvpA family protein [Aquincola sp. MAHUQ-54]|uniref:CvpA family protein n=1 Tax=Aquincola agrisoli TaxID=3119538 RepID=A0AAW9QBY7_9BURK